MADFIPAFEANSAGLLRWNGRQARCALGRSGVIAAEAKREGDGASPLGLWPMRQVFWRPDRMEKPAGHLPVIELDPETGWCDDPAHPAYNRQIRLPFPLSHEKLWREDHIYDLIVVLGFNDDPVIPGRGSAIFLHLARPDFSPTEGCVACTRDDLVDILRLAKPGDGLHIVDGPPSPA
jgi:L,D-peptidoglycan transpeptidase YkuD (ErfK/YbiS/YcfS/YnhG family)